MRFVTSRHLCLQKRATDQLSSTINQHEGKKLGYLSHTVALFLLGKQEKRKIKSDKVTQVRQCTTILNKSAIVYQ